MNKRLFEAVEDLYGLPEDPFFIYNLNLEIIAYKGTSFIADLGDKRKKHEWFLESVRAMADRAGLGGERYIDSFCNEAERYVTITKLLKSAKALPDVDYDDVIIMLRRITGTEEKLGEEIPGLFDEEDINYHGFAGEVEQFLNYSRTVAETPPEGFMYHDMWVKQFDNLVEEARKRGDDYLDILREKKEELDSMIPKIAGWDSRGRIDYETRRDEWNHL